MSTNTAENSLSPIATRKLREGKRERNRVTERQRKTETEREKIERWRDRGTDRMRDCLRDRRLPLASFGGLSLLAAPTFEVGLTPQIYCHTSIVSGNTLTGTLRYGLHNLLYICFSYPVCNQN